MQETDRSLQAEGRREKRVTWDEKKFPNVVPWNHDVVCSAGIDICNTCVVYFEPGGSDEYSNRKDRR